MYEWVLSNGFCHFCSCIGFVCVFTSFFVRCLLLLALLYLAQWFLYCPENRSDFGIPNEWIDFLRRMTRFFILILWIFFIASFPFSLSHCFDSLLNIENKSYKNPWIVLIDLKIIIVEATQKTENVDVYIRPQFSCHCVFLFVDDDGDDSGSSAPFGSSTSANDNQINGPEWKWKAFRGHLLSEFIDLNSFGSKRKREFRHPAPHTREMRRAEREVKREMKNNIHTAYTFIFTSQSFWALLTKLYVKLKKIYHESAVVVVVACTQLSSVHSVSISPNVCLHLAFNTHSQRII